jgi:hypothetical protein
MKKEIQVIEHRRKKILLFDFSYCQCKEEIEPIIQSAKQWLQDKEPHSVLTLTDVTGAHYDTETLNLLKHLTTYNKPYVKAGAIIGITRPLMRLAYNMVMTFSKRNLPIFETREEAIEWLVNQ